jgi:hypothetical protein
MHRDDNDTITSMLFDPPKKRATKSVVSAISFNSRKKQKNTSAYCNSFVIYNRLNMMLHASRSVVGQRASAVSTGFVRHGVGPLRSSLGPSPPAKLARSVVASGYNNNNQGGEVLDRVVGSVPYLLPLFDSLRYGRFLMLQFPIISTIISPLNPLIQLYFTVPFASLASFFAIYLLIVNNFNWDRRVRFNAMQAVLLDIILIFPGLFESVFKIRPMGGVGLQIYIQVYNAIFLFVLVAVVYGIVSSLIGQTARIPLVADAADAQTR